MNPPLVSAFMHNLIKLKNSDNYENDVRKTAKIAESEDEWNFTPNELNQLKDQMRKVTLLFSCNNANCCKAKCSRPDELR